MTTSLRTIMSRRSTPMNADRTKPQVQLSGYFDYCNDAVCAGATGTV